MFYIFEADLETDRQAVLSQIEEWLQIVEKEDDGSILTTSPDDAPFCLNYSGEPEGYLEWSVRTANDLKTHTSFDSVIVVEYHSDDTYYAFDVIHEATLED